MDERITWEAADGHTAKAIFTNGSIKISAILFFNDLGELINFESDDRYYSPASAADERFKWSTPVKDYGDFGGIRIVSRGETAWTMPDGRLI